MTFCSVRSTTALRVGGKRRKRIRLGFQFRFRHLSESLAVWLAYQWEIKQLLSVLKRSGMLKKLTRRTEFSKQCEGCIGDSERNAGWTKTCWNKQMPYIYLTEWTRGHSQLWEPITSMTVLCVCVFGCSYCPSWSRRGCRQKEFSGCLAPPLE